MRRYKHVVASINAQLARDAAANGYPLTDPMCSDDDVIALAKKILEGRIRITDALESPSSVRDYLRLHLAHLEHGEFHAVFLDAAHRVIGYESLFRGTLTHTSVYPREVVKAALRCNCAAVIFSHCHPSGVSEPSQSDRALTEGLKRALDLVGVRVLDHFIVAGTHGYSFSEHGLL